MVVLPTTEIIEPHFTGSRVRLVLVCQSKDLSIQRPADIADIITKSDLGQMVKDLR